MSRQCSTPNSIACRLGFFTLAVIAAVAAGCGEQAPAAGPAADTAAVAAADGGGDAASDSAARTQYYAATLKFHGGKFDGRTVSLDRDLTQVSGVLSFGNSHMTPPAVAFGLEDHVPQPYTTATGQPTIMPLTLQLRFGILVEAVGFAAHASKAGSYAFSCKAPLVQVVLDNELFRSTCPDNSGFIEIEKWSSEPGGNFRGVFKGKVGRHKTDPSGTDDCAPGYAEQACKYATPSWIDIEGEYDFTLPELNKD